MSKTFLEKDLDAEMAEMDDDEGDEEEDEGNMEKDEEKGEEESSSSEEEEDEDDPAVKEQVSPRSFCYAICYAVALQKG
jgi:hypothetical protein